MLSRFYWYFASLLFLVCQVQSQCLTDQSDTLQMGRYTEFVQDQVISLCQNFKVTLPTNRSSYSHMAVFGKMEQFFGVRFGMKHFEVASKYLPDTHEIALTSVFYAKYEWNLVQVNYFISCDPSLYFGTFIAEEWNTDQCDASSFERKSQTTFAVANIEKSSAIVMLKGMTCNTEECSITKLNWKLENGIVTVSYTFSQVFQFSSEIQPLKVQFSYIVVGKAAEFSFLYFPQLLHSQTVRAGRAFNNFIIDDQIEKVKSVDDEATQYFLGLSEIGSVLNRYIFLKVQPKIYDTTLGVCFSLIECEQQPICGNCQQNETFILPQGYCNCSEPSYIDELGNCTAPYDEVFEDDNQTLNQTMNETQNETMEINDTLLQTLIDVESQSQMMDLNQTQMMNQTSNQTLNETEVGQMEMEVIIIDCQQPLYFDGQACVECEPDCVICSDDGKCLECQTGSIIYIFEGRLKCLLFN